MYFIDARLQLIYSMVNDNLAVGNWYADDTDKTDERGLKFPCGVQVIFQTRITRITRILKAALCLLHLIRMEKRDPCHPRNPRLKNYLHAAGKF